MKALSIQQPWAWAILHAGKNIENRTWPIIYTGPFLIHAGKKFDHSGYQHLLKLNIDHFPRRDDFQMGGFVGMSRIIDCVDYHSSEWFCGPWGFVLDINQTKSFGFIPYSGKRFFFNVPNEIVKTIQLSKGL